MIKPDSLFSRPVLVFGAGAVCEKGMNAVRNSLLKDGTIGNLATNDPNPWVREHARRLLDDSSAVTVSGPN